MSKAIYAFELIDVNGKSAESSFHLLEITDSRRYGQFLANATWKVVRMTRPESVLEDLNCLSSEFLSPNPNIISNPLSTY